MSIFTDGNEFDRPAIWPISSCYDRDHLAQLWSPASLTIPVIGRPAAGPTFREVMDRYYREVVKVYRTPKGIANVDSLLHCHLYPAWGEVPLDQIDKRTIKNLLHEIGTTRPQRYRDRTDGRRGRANSIYSVLRRFFAWASDEDNGQPYLENDPFLGLRQPFATGERDRVLTEDEIRLFWRAAGMEKEPYRSVARLLLLTAQRRSEIADVERWQIDRQAQTLNLPIRSTKSHRAHVVPLSDLAMEILDAVPRRAGEMRLFGRKDDLPHSTSRAFCNANERIRKRMLELRRHEIAESHGDPDDAHIPHWVLHDLRRTAASVMCELGHSLEVVDKVLNHGPAGGGSGRTINAVSRLYCRYEYVRERRAALQDLATYIGGLVKGSATENMSVCASTISRTPASPMFSARRSDAEGSVTSDLV